MTEYYLKKRRNITSLSDFIVNVGGVIGCALELAMGSDEVYKSKVSATGVRRYLKNLIYNTVARNVSEIYQRLQETKNSDRIFREEALALAEERLVAADKEYWM